MGGLILCVVALESDTQSTVCISSGRVERLSFVGSFTRVFAMTGGE